MQKKIISRCYDYYYLVKGIDANFRSDGAPVIPGLIRNPEISWMPDRARHDGLKTLCLINAAYSLQTIGFLSRRIKFCFYMPPMIGL